MVLTLVSATVLCAQTDWRPIGSSALELGLAGPVSGSMANVWYSADGSILYASTGDGKVYQTEDFESWKAAVNAPDPPALIARQPVRKPDAGARYVTVGANSADIWGLGNQLYRSEDGASWQTLTSYRSTSVIGPGIHGVAVSPSDPNQLAVANEDGVWRSMDGGLTWSSLNLHLPNLSIKGIVGTPSGGHAARILSGDGVVLQLPPGSQLWQMYPAIQPAAEAVRNRAIRRSCARNITAFVESADGQQIYAGSDDGRIWVSIDRGASFHATAATASAEPRRRSGFMSIQRIRRW